MAPTELIEAVPFGWIEVDRITLGESFQAFKLKTRGHITASRLSAAYQIQFVLMILAGVGCLYLPWDEREPTFEIPLRNIFAVGIWWGATCMLLGMPFLPRLRIRVDEQRRTVEFTDSATGLSVPFDSLICLQLCSKASGYREQPLYYQVNIAWRDGRQMNGADRIVRRCLTADARRHRCESVAQLLSARLDIPCIEAGAEAA